MVGSSQCDAFFVVVGELETGMQLAKWVEVVCPHNIIAVGGNDGGSFAPTFSWREGALGDLVFIGNGWVVGEEHAFEVDVVVGRVVQFYPVVTPSVLVGCNGVVSTYLVDYDRRRTGSDETTGLQGLEDGLQFGIGIRVEL